MDQFDDATLVKLTQGGNIEAFEEIDHRYRKRLCAFLAKRTSCFSHAEDIAQRALIKAFQAIHSLQSGEKLAAWLYRIAFRLALDDARQRRPRQMNEDHEILDRKKSPLEILLQEEEKKNIWLLAKKILTPDEYTSLWLKYAEDLKIDAIGEIMNRTAGSVRVLLFRARQKMLKFLEEKNRRADES